MLRDSRAWHGGTPNLGRYVRAIPCAIFALVSTHPMHNLIYSKGSDRLLVVAAAGARWAGHGLGAARPHAAVRRLGDHDRARPAHLPPVRGRGRVCTQSPPTSLTSRDIAKRLLCVFRAVVDVPWQPDFERTVDGGGTELHTGHKVARL